MKVLYVSEITVKLPDDFEGTFLEALAYGVDKMKENNAMNDKYVCDDTFKIGDHKVVDKMVEEIKVKGNGHVNYSGIGIDE